MTSATIQIVNFEKQVSQYAIVKHVGSGYRLPNGTRQALEVKEGDKVLLGKYSGSDVDVASRQGDPVQYGYENMVMVDYDAILAILED